MTTKDISKEDVERFKVLLEYLKILSNDGINQNIEKQLLVILENTLPFFSHLVLSSVFPKINRLTVNRRVLGSNKRIKEIAHLKYPPSCKVTKYGRCNLPNQSILYSSMIGMTAMNESQPLIGDLITESVWQVKDNKPLLFCPIFKNQPNSSINTRTFEINQLYDKKLKEFPEQIREQIDTLVQFVADAFTKRIAPEANLEYLFSAFFSNKILNEFENGQIEAIYYPSVKDGLSFENLAIKPDVFDSNYELIEVKESLCVTDITDGNRGYFLKGISDCKEFDTQTGKILWSPHKIYQSPQYMSEIKTKYNVEID